MIALFRDDRVRVHLKTGRVLFGAFVHRTADLVAVRLMGIEREVVGIPNESIDRVALCGDLATSARTRIAKQQRGHFKAIRRQAA